MAENSLKAEVQRLKKEVDDARNKLLSLQQEQGTQFNKLREENRLLQVKGFEEAKVQRQTKVEQLTTDTIESIRV